MRGFNFLTLSSIWIDSEIIFSFESFSDVKEIAIPRLKDETMSDKRLEAASGSEEPTISDTIARPSSEWFAIDLDPDSTRKAFLDLRPPLNGTQIENEKALLKQIVRTDSNRFDFCIIQCGKQRPNIAHSSRWTRIFLSVRRENRSKANVVNSFDDRFLDLFHGVASPAYD